VGEVSSRRACVACDEACREILVVHCTSVLFYLLSYYPGLFLLNDASLHECRNLLSNLLLVSVFVQSNSSSAFSGSHFVSSGSHFVANVQIPVSCSD
jgi:hypothetical protein